MNPEIKTKSIISAIEYELGNKQYTYQAASGFAEAKMPDIPELWGWGNFYESGNGLEDMKVKAIQKTIDASELEPQDIEMVIISSSSFTPGIENNTKLSKGILSATGLNHAKIVGVTLNGCSGLLSAINLADAMIISGKYKNILIVSADVLPEQTNRFQSYGIFSDSCVSCIVKAESKSGYEILKEVSLSDLSMMNDDAPFSSLLSQRANNSILDACSLNFSDITKIFCNNLFIPIVTVKEQEGGFIEEQLYRNNIADKGHCFSADTLINLQDYQEETDVHTGEYFILAADSPGARTNILLKAL
jgi:3-oxoacyl-[acyl-carrier-protein] synthase-3